MAKKITALIIMDGFGIAPEGPSSAISAQNTPNLTALKEKYPNSSLGASGLSVGLPDGQMGNSEVGHLNIGAGRIVYQELTRITKSIEDGDFFENEDFLSAIDNCVKNGSDLHVMGLVSDGGVHSHNTHLYALLKLAKEKGIGDRTYIHCFMDGRDVPPDSGKGYIEELVKKTEEIGAGRIAVISGRYYAMDRDNRWERVNKAYDAMVLGEGNTCDDPVRAMQESYDNEVLDEFVIPVVITDGGKPTATVKENDSIIFFNFRPDRAREITRTFVDPEFSGFERKNGFFPVRFVCMTTYDATFVPSFEGISVAYKPQVLKNTFGEYISNLGRKQFRIAETEKYAHVTFFFNGGVEKPNEGEDRVLIPSPKVATYDLQPEMSAYPVTEKACELIRGGEYDVMILNYANCDMVGHTGVMEAAKKAVATVDECVGKVVSAILEGGGEVIITADHGNADIMIDPETGGAFTAHSTNPVPVILVSDSRKDQQLRSDGILADLAPTLLTLMGEPVPAEMTGRSLIR